MLTEKDLSRFWVKVDKDGPLPDQSNPHYAGLDCCWLWTAAKTPDGYGVFGLGHKIVYAHRVSFEIHAHPPGSEMVCHKCDFASCVNPLHLWLGTNQANMQDASNKLRTGPQICPERLPRGIQHFAAKFTEEQIREIRRLDASTSRIELAKQFKTTSANIGYIVRRQTWVHVA